MHRIVIHARVCALLLAATGVISWAALSTYAPGLQAAESDLTYDYDQGCRYGGPGAQLNNLVVSPLDGFVHAFEHPDFKGACQRFRGEPGGRGYRNDMEEMQGVGNDKISTVILGRNTKVTLCVNEALDATCRSWGPFPEITRISALDSLNDQASSIWVDGNPTRHKN